MSLRAPRRHRAHALTALTALTALLAFLAPASTRAQLSRRRPWALESAAIQRDPRSAATVWDYARNPGLRGAEVLTIEATALLSATQRMVWTGILPAEQRGQLLDDLLQRFRAAVARAPDMGPALLGLADVLDMRGESAEALAVLQRARVSLADRPELADVLFRLGVVYTRLERYDETRDVYEQYVALPMESEARGSGLCNLAETYVSLGDLPRAVATYHACVDLRPDYAGAWWGLASALDRDGRGVEAERAGREALNRDPDWQGIRGPNVFYVPAYDVHYYEALAFHAMDKLEPELAAWERYLSEGGAQGRFARRAQSHVAALHAALHPVPAVNARAARPARHGAAATGARGR